MSKLKGMQKEISRKIYMTENFVHFHTRVFHRRLKPNFKIFATNILLNGDLMIKSPFRGILVAKILKFASQTSVKKTLILEFFKIVS